MIPKSCDTMVALGEAARHGQTIFAKNSDRPPDECQPLELHPRRTHPEGTVTHCQFVSLPEVETAYRHVGSRPSWCWGYEHGFNEHQVVIGNEGLASKWPVAKEPKLIGMEILRLGLERSRTAAEAVEVMTDLISEYGQGKFENDVDVRTYDNGYIVADPREAYVIETAGHQWAVKKVEGSIGISNVYSVETDWNELSPEAESRAVEQGWWEEEGGFNFADAYTENSRAEGSGAMRRLRSCSVLKQREGKLDTRAMMALLSDHGDGKMPEEPFQTEINPGSGICVHTGEDGKGGNTAAGLVADLCVDGSRLPVYWCCFYSPCLGLFLPIFIEGELPPVLGIGEAEPSDESPWWLFHRLSRVARARPGGVNRVRERWADLQRQLFDSAYAMAGEGRRAIDEGNVDEASRRLTEYMEENTAAMLGEVKDMLREFQNPAE
ncbi:MAG: hypothetical protein HOC74_04195 [Gemmatimonadetes bacterium]|nr:hypothetical protein [Gemmatimonadota bacterium]